jgi:hypothetical protein
MSKTTDTILCVVYSALLSGMGWLVVTVSQLPPPKPVATLAPARPVKTVIFLMSQEEAIDRTVICGGGEDKPRSELAGEPVHRC